MNYNYYQQYLTTKSLYINLKNYLGGGKTDNTNTVIDREQLVQRTPERTQNLEIPSAPKKNKKNREEIENNLAGIRPIRLFPEIYDQPLNNLLLPDLTPDTLETENYNKIKELVYDCNIPDLLTFDDITNGDVILVVLTGGTIENPTLNESDTKKAANIIFRNVNGIFTNILTPIQRKNYINYYNHIYVDQNRVPITGFQLFRVKCL